jgi:hypothetical protein
MHRLRQVLLLPGWLHNLAVSSDSNIPKPLFSESAHIPEADARRGMKDMGMDEWTTNIALDLFDSYRKGDASLVSDGVESITGNKPISFHQFANEYVEAFR